MGMSVRYYGACYDRCVIRCSYKRVLYVNELSVERRHLKSSDSKPQHPINIDDRSVQSHLEERERDINKNQYNFLQFHL